MAKREKIFNVENEEFVLKQIDKLQPLNYNRFRWWRRFTQKHKPLHNSSPLLDKIQNGDLDFPIIGGKLNLLKWRLIINQFLV